MSYIIRKITKDDLKDFTKLVTKVWNQTYKGIVNEDFLNNLYQNEEERYQNSYKKFDEQNNHRFVLEINNEIVGFMSVGKSDDEDFQNCGEINSLYIIDSYQKMGYGKMLFEKGKEELKNMGFNKMIIGCLKKNKSNEFYRYLGGKLVKTRIFKLLNLEENVYLYDNI